MFMYLISLEKNVLLVGIKPYLGKEIINDNFSPALKLLSNGRDLILKDIKPTRSFKEEDENDGKTSSALGSLGLKPKPAI